MSHLVVTSSPGAAWKRPFVRLLGRERANRLSAPYHDWLAGRRIREFLRLLRGDQHLVNLGCGHRPLEGWINLDHARGAHVQVVWDLCRPLPFASGTCSA